MPCSKNAVLDNSSAILSLRISKRWARRQFWLIGPKRVLSCKLLGDKSRYQGLNPWLLSFATTVQTIEPPRYSKMKGKRTWLILFPQSIEFVSDGSNSDFQLIFCFSCKLRPNESIMQIFKQSNPLKKNEDGICSDWFGFTIGGSRSRKIDWHSSKWQRSCAAKLIRSCFTQGPDSIKTLQA